MRATPILLSLLLIAPSLGAGPTLLVVQKGDDSLGLYDAETGARVARIAVGTKPHEVALSADGRTAYVTLYGIDRYTEAAEGGRALAVVDLGRREKVGEIDLGRHRRPHGIARGRSGRLYVTCDTPPSLLVIDPGTGGEATVRGIRLGQELPHMVAVAPDERTAYVANSGSGSISIVATDRGEELAAVPIGGVPMGLALAADGRRLYATNRTGNAVVVIDTATRDVVVRAEIPGNPARVRLAPDGAHLLLSLIEAGDVVEVEAGPLRVTRRLHVGRHAEGLGLDPSGRFGYASAQDDDRVIKFSLADWTAALEIPTARKPDPTLILDPDPAGSGRDRP